MNFEKATRLKLRFETGKGLLTTEDLWDLPLTGNGVNLDKIAVALDQQLKADTAGSFVTKSKKPSDLLQLKFDVVKYIIDTKLAEADDAKTKADTKAKKERILAIIDRKQDAQLEETSLEDLLKMATAL